MIIPSGRTFDAVFLDANGKEIRVPVAAWSERGDGDGVIALVASSAGDHLVTVDHDHVGIGTFLRLVPSGDGEEDFYRILNSELPAMFDEFKEVLRVENRKKPGPTAAYSAYSSASDVFVSMTAQMCHEVNRTYALSLGDTSHQPWSSAPQDQRDSAMHGVQAVLDDPTITPEQLHEEWCGHKIKDGWKYGTAKDPEKKTHPCLVPYADLPEFQRTKDALFRSVVQTAMLISGRVASPEIVDLLGH